MLPCLLAVRDGRDAISPLGQQPRQYHPKDWIVICHQDVHNWKDSGVPGNWCVTVAEGPLPGEFSETTIRVGMSHHRLAG